jgi:translation initiation factor IF-3
VGVIDAFKIGENIEVTFNLRGREWTSPELVKKYFNTLEAWRVQKAESAPTPANVPVDELQQIVDTSSDLPF